MVFFGAVATNDAGFLSSKRYIVSPAFDHIFIIWAPLQWAFIGGMVYWLDLADLPIPWGEESYLPFFPVFAMSFAVGHIFAGFFRSHANMMIVREYPIRLFVVPLLFLIAMNVSLSFFIIYAVLVVWFDLWHSSMQVFGFARLYDKAAGNDGDVGRKLDMGMALIVYSAAIPAGVGLARHIQRFPWLEGQFGWDAWSVIRVMALRNQSYLTTIVLVIAAIYILVYCVSYWRFAQQGYKFSIWKIASYVAMAIASTIAWGFDSFLQAFLIIECFHAWQYYGIVWWSEGKSITKLFGLANVPLGIPIAIVVYAVASFAFGFYTAVFAVGHFPTTFVLLCEGFHYWSDGWVWSVRKQQI